MLAVEYGECRAIRAVRPPRPADLRPPTLPRMIGEAPIDRHSTHDALDSPVGAHQRGSAVPAVLTQQRPNGTGD
jgi:hypothetical protein